MVSRTMLPSVPPTTRVGEGYDLLDRIVEIDRTAISHANYQRQPGNRGRQGIDVGDADAERRVNGLSAIAVGLLGVNRIEQHGKAGGG